MGRARSFERQNAGGENLLQNQAPGSVQVYEVNLASEGKAEFGHERKTRLGGKLPIRKHGHVHIAVGPQCATGCGAKHKGQPNFFVLGKGAGYFLSYGVGHVRILLWLIAR